MSRRIRFMGQAERIIADAKARLAEDGGRIGTHNGRCHMKHDRCMIVKLVAEAERLRRRLAWLVEASGIDVIGGECLHEAAVVLSEEPTEEDYLEAAITLIDRAISREE